MKKIILALAILFIIPLANAGLMFTGAGWCTGDPVTLSLVSDESTQSFGIGALRGYSCVTFSDIYINPLFTVESNPGELKDGSVNDIRLFQISGVCAQGIEIPAGEVLWSAKIYLEPGRDASVDDWTGINPFGMPPFPVETTYNGEQIDLWHYYLTIPEPMTMAFLGLGGLFIRRRRA